MKRCKILYDLLKINFMCLISRSFPVIHSLNDPFNSYICHSFICSSTHSLIPLVYLPPSLLPSLRPFVHIYQVSYMPGCSWHHGQNKQSQRLSEPPCRPWNQKSLSLSQMASHTHYPLARSPHHTCGHAASPVSPRFTSRIFTGNESHSTEMAFSFVFLTRRHVW